MGENLGGLKSCHLFKRRSHRVWATFGFDCWRALEQQWSSPS